VTRPEIPEALASLDDLTRRLRVECPWDREQDELTIVPHTVEEAYELADAANAGDDAKLLDELGDVLFQVHFLSLLLEERGAGDLAAVADHCRAKLVRRHPHVFGDTEADSAAEVLRNWDEIKREEEGRDRGTFADVPENLPALLLARKVQRRAASAGAYDLGAQEALQDLSACVEALAHAPDDPRARFGMVGAVLFAAVHAARRLKVDPELALRSAAHRFRETIESEVP
jgi:MazG family protein